MELEQYRTKWLSEYAFLSNIMPRMGKGLRLLYLQATKWACHNVMDAARRHEPPGSETKELITQGVASSLSFMFMLFPLAPMSYGDKKNGICVCREHSSLPHSQETQSLKFPQSLIMGYEQTYPTSTLEGDYTIPGSKRTCPLLHWSHCLYSPDHLTTQTS